MLNIFNRNSNLKFLSAEGVGHLWEKIRERFDPKLDKIEAKDESVVIENNNVVGVQVSPKAGNAVSVVDNEGEEGIYVPQETDPTVPAWAKEPTKPSYTPQEVGALPDDTFIPSRVSDLTDDSGHYTKPADGIPASDLAESVRQSIADQQDIFEYNSVSQFPAVGVANKIYIAKDTNVTYRWSGNAYAIIGSDLTLGETANSAYRGDRGKAAYDHATAKGSAFNSGLYKIETNSEGHVVSATGVVKKDITDLGIPGSVPVNVSELNNDSGYLTTETDPTVPSWAKQKNKPTYTAQEVGAYAKPAGGIPASDIAPGVVPDISGKADKVSNATNNNFASLDANGNLKDSGHKHGDYAPEKIVAVSTTQPSDSGNKLWIKDSSDDEYTIPTYTEHQALASEVSALKPTATNSDIGKAIVIKTIDQNGKPTAYEYGEAGGSGGGAFVVHAVEDSDTGETALDKTWIEIKEASSTTPVILTSPNGAVLYCEEILEEAHGGHRTCAVTFRSSDGAVIWETNEETGYPMLNDEIVYATIDDEAGEGNTRATFSADKITRDHSNLLNALTQSQENTNIAISAHPVGDLFWYNGTLHVATSAIAVGDTIVDTGTGANCKDTTISEAMIRDIQINGSSILNNGVANIPQASESDFGVVKVKDTRGTQINNNQLALYAASLSYIKSGSSDYMPIVPSRQHASAFFGLAKAAGDTTQAQQTGTTVGTYTEDAKSSISQMLNGAVQVTGTTPVIVAKPGVPYRCGECATLDITAPESGCVDITFTSGSTPTVLTVTSAKANTTIKWANGFDPTSLDANTTYEINILDGEWGVTGSWA